MTDAGTLLRDYAERLINLRDEVKKGLSELTGLNRGELSLGVERKLDSCTAAGTRAVQKAPSRHSDSGPSHVFPRYSHEVLNYRLDLGAVSFVPREAQLQATEILKDELTLVVPPKHLLARRKEIDVTDLENESFVAHSVESPFRRRVIELFGRNRTTLNMPIEMPTIESIKRFVQMGMGVAIVPRMCVAWEIDRGWDERSQSPATEFAAHVYLVSPPGRPPAARRRRTDPPAQNRVSDMRVSR